MIRAYEVSWLEVGSLGVLVVCRNNDGLSASWARKDLAKLGSIAENATTCWMWPGQ